MDGKNGAITTLGILYPIYAFITDPDLLSFLATVFSGVVIAGFVKAMEIAYKEYVRKKEKEEDANDG